MKQLSARDNGIASLVRNCLLVAGMCLGWGAAVFAHPISLSSTMVDIREDSLEATIEVMLEDLVLYHGLSAGPDARFPADDLMQAARDHRDFLKSDFSLRNGSGEEVPLEVKLDDSSQIVADGVQQTELMSRHVVYKIVGRIPEPIEFLTIMQTFGGAEAVLPAVMDLMLLQNGVLIERPVQITHGRPHTVRLDWSRPPDESSRGLAALRRQREQAFRQRLGIASYAGLYSFVYLLPHEVRHEILVPLLTLEKWLPIEREDAEFLEVAEQQALVDRIGQFVRQAGKLEINGQAVNLEIARIQFFGLDANDFAVNATPRRLNVYQARVGIILRHRSDDVIHDLRAEWNQYNDFAPFMRTVVLVEQDPAKEHFFRPETNTFSWQRTTDPALPIIQAVLNDSAIVQPSDPSDVFKRLLGNVYQSFQLEEDSEIYDAIAQSATDQLLPKLYLQIKRELVMTEQGSDLARVDMLTVLSAESQDKSSTEQARYRCRWRVEGTIEHWGHLHTRTNDYEAWLTLRHQDGCLKLADLEPIDVQLVQFQTRLRQSDRPQ